MLPFLEDLAEAFEDLGLLVSQSSGIKLGVNNEGSPHHICSSPQIAFIPIPSAFDNNENTEPQSIF
jgi:hypothetical protein